MSSRVSCGQVSLIGVKWVGRSSKMSRDVGLCEAGWISEVFRREARSGQIENN